MNEGLFRCIVSSHRDYAYMVGEHYHDCYELVYYINGHGKTLIGEEQYQFTPHSFALISPGVIHNEKAMKDVVDLTYLGFEIKNDAHILRSGVFNDTENLVILKCLNKISNEMKNKAYNYTEMINALVSQLIISCIRVQNKGIKSDEDSVFDHIRTYIEYNCMKNINGITIANDVGYNYDYFRKMFKKHFGVSIKEYILNVKMEHAIALLKSGKYSINEISDLIGFSGPSHFISLFKKKYGITPAVYLQQYNLKDVNKDNADYKIYHKFDEK